MKKDKWIDITKKKPEEGQIVLTTNHCHLDPAQERYYVVAKFENGYWFEPDTKESFFEPTHWMELFPPLYKETK